MSKDKKTIQQQADDHWKDHAEKNQLRDEPQGYRHSKPYTDFRYAVGKYSENKLKEQLFRHPGREVRNLHEKGYGVIATMPIKHGEIIEECMVAYETIEPGWEYLDGVMHARNQSVLASYRFAGPANSNDNTKGKHAQSWVVAFGDASTYNHSSEPNMVWYHEPAQRLIVFIALRDIEAGEELCHSYASGAVDQKIFKDLVLKRHYHPQFMREPIDFKPRPAPQSGFDVPTLDHSKLNVSELRTHDYSQGTRKVTYKQSKPPVAPSSTYKKYYQQEVTPKRGYDPKKVNELHEELDPLEIDPNWEPPQRGKKKGVKEFLKTTKKGSKQSFNTIGNREEDE